MHGVSFSLFIPDLNPRSFCCALVAWIAYTPVPLCAQLAAHMLALESRLKCQMLTDLFEENSEIATQGSQADEMSFCL